MIEKKKKNYFWILKFFKGLPRWPSWLWSDTILLTGCYWWSTFISDSEFRWLSNRLQHCAWFVCISFNRDNRSNLFLYYSGHYSWRNTTQGSWFIQALIQALGKQEEKMTDLLTLLTIVNRKVAYEFESNVPNDPDFDKKKQVPCITSMLTRLVYFPSKI